MLTSFLWHRQSTMLCLLSSKELLNIHILVILPSTTKENSWSCEKVSVIYERGHTMTNYSDSSISPFLMTILNNMWLKLCIQAGKNFKERMPGEIAQDQV